MLAEPNPTAETVARLKAILTERFPDRTPEVSTVSFDEGLRELRQREDESLLAYYQRVNTMMTRIDCPDRNTLPKAKPLSTLEDAMLGYMIRSFVGGILDTDVKRESTRGLASAGRSLEGVYTVAEEARRTKLEMKKLLDEEYKRRELKFYSLPEPCPEQPLSDPAILVGHCLSASLSACLGLRLHECLPSSEGVPLALPAP